MKKIKILQMAVLATLVVLVISCSPGRSYYYDRYPATTHASLSLIINPWPGIAISHYPDGRYYYRSPEGYIYWRGYNNRYYLDRDYIGRIRYNQREYNEWKHYDRRYNGRRRHR